MELRKDDPLFAEKQDLFAAHGVHSRHAADLPATDLLIRARILELKPDELYAACEARYDLTRPLNPRNEAAALSLLLTHTGDLCKGDGGKAEQLQGLAAPYEERCGASAAAAGASSAPTPPDGPEALLCRWAADQGMRCQLQPARWDRRAAPPTSADDGATPAPRLPPLRGAAAATSLLAGAVALELPAQLLISYDTAAASELGAALARLPPLRDDPESLALVWTMAERWDEGSSAAPFWRALPPSFHTGFGAPEEEVALLRGTPLAARARAARAHASASFEALQPVLTALLGAYSAHLRAEWFTREAYTWALELWYAYAIQVLFPDGVVRPCLAPVASLLNHSARPHIVRFSRLEPASETLRLVTLRPAAAGDEVTLSYGPLPNEDLLLFYGFCLDDNPFDGVAALPLKAGPMAGSEASTQLLAQLGLSDVQHRLTLGSPLPLQLVAAARIAAAATPADLRLLQLAAAGAAAAAGSASQLRRTSAAVAAVAGAEVDARHAEAALQLLAPSLKQARLHQAALERVAAALRGAGPAEAADGAAGRAPAVCSTFLHHAHTYLSVQTRILGQAQAAVEQLRSG